MQFRSITSYSTYPRIDYSLPLCNGLLSTWRLLASFPCPLFFSPTAPAPFNFPALFLLLLPPALSPVGSHPSWAMVHKTNPSDDVLPILHTAWIASHTYIFLGCLLFFATKACCWFMLSSWLTVDLFLNGYFFTSCPSSWVCAVFNTCLN